jgi:2,4-dienoyl-CoA reductase-like NADH-dependent reductase (Old Yellow Enzyme family)
MNSVDAENHRYRPHIHGTKIFSQLTHGGHTSLEHPPHIMWAPTQMPEPSSHFSTKAMDEDDIHAVIAGFAVSARKAVEAGFDGIEVKVAHDGLLRSFASPFFNRRGDRYGGSFENRMRLSLEVIEAIKKQTGDTYPVGVRICVNEFTTFGYDLEYGLRMAETLETSGLVDYFNARTKPRFPFSSWRILRQRENTWALSTLTTKLGAQWEPTNSRS